MAAGKAYPRTEELKELVTTRLRMGRDSNAVSKTGPGSKQRTASSSIFSSTMAQNLAITGLDTWMRT